VKNRRSAKLLAFATAASLLVAACGGDDDDSADTPTTEGEATETTAGEAPAPTTEAAAPTTEAAAPTTEAAAPTTEGAAPTTAAEGGEGGMRVTYTLSDAAVWSDGTPITAADIECTWLATVNTPGSITTTGYELITSVTEGATPQEVAVEFSGIYAPWKTLFNFLLKADAHENCSDVSADFGGLYTYGGGPYMVTEWTAEQAIWQKNPEYAGANTGGPDQIVIVPAEDGPTLLKAGTVDFIYPQAFTGIDQELNDPNVAFNAEPGGQFEAFYFQQDDACEPNETRSCAFADDVFRAAFAKSIDMDGVYNQIYAPFAQGIPLLECGPIAPGPYCNPVFTDTYDPEGAAALLEGDGWTMNGDGFWEKDGVVPEIHFAVSAPNPRREGTQEYLIPLLAQAGFNAIADNCEATPCFFQNRLPALQYDFTMYISTVAPDPAYITSSFTCAQVPGPENDNQGQNNVGWCNEEASALLEQADAELDEATRAELVQGAIALMLEDSVLLPLLQFPNVGAYRTDRVEGTQNNLANYWAFKDWYNFVDVDGDGQVVIGAEQYITPDCTNPVTECANSSWFQWTAGFPNFPGLYDTTNEQTFEPGEFLAGEAVVEEL
jgi:peptide/nickel transport system substrate-binding protein